MHSVSYCFICFLFKPNQLPVIQVSRGKTWLAEDGLRVGLVDIIMHSDSYLKQAMQERGVLVYTVRRKQQKQGGNRWLKALGGTSSAGLVFSRGEEVLIELKQMLIKLNGMLDVNKNDVRLI